MNLFTFLKNVDRLALFIASLCEVRFFSFNLFGILLFVPFDVRFSGRCAVRIPFHISFLVKSDDERQFLQNIFRFVFCFKLAFLSTPCGCSSLQLHFGSFDLNWFLLTICFYYIQNSSFFFILVFWFFVSFSYLVFRILFSSLSIDIQLYMHFLWSTCVLEFILFFLLLFLLVLDSDLDLVMELKTI